MQWECELICSHLKGIKMNKPGWYMGMSNWVLVHALVSTMRRIWWHELLPDVFYQIATDSDSTKSNQFLVARRSLKKQLATQSWCRHLLGKMLVFLGWRAPRCLIPPRIPLKGEIYPIPTKVYLGSIEGPSIPRGPPPFSIWFKGSLFLRPFFYGRKEVAFFDEN